MGLRSPYPTVVGDREEGFTLERASCSTHSRVVLAERLDADQQAQPVSGSWWSLSWLLGECCGAGQVMLAHAPWQGQGSGQSLPLPHPEPHPRAEWQRAHRSQPQVQCTGRWSGSSLGPGGRLPQLRATEHTDEVTLGPTLLCPASCVPTHQVVDSELMQCTTLHLHITAQATVERGLYTGCPWALGQGSCQQRQYCPWVLAVKLLGDWVTRRAARGWCSEIPGAVLRALSLPYRA